MTDFRALCAELLLFAKQAGEIAANESLWPKCDPDYSMLDRTAAALAQPEPQGPTQAELRTFACKWWHSFGFVKNKATCTWVIDQIAPEHFADFSRDLLARWGRPAIEPVPVSEGMPGPEDVNDDGEVWVEEPGGAYSLGETGDSDWEPHRYVLRCIEWRDHRHNHRWLPHWALPVPAPANTINQED
jgi:hypothetical protein